MTARSTDVRQWAIDRGYDLGSSGRLPDDVKREYQDWVDAGGAGAVTEADYPPAPAGGDDDGLADEARAAAASRRAPRSDRGGRGGKARQQRRGGSRRGWKETLKRWSSGGGPRSPLADFGEEVWTDLAWLAQPLPPLARMLQVQAPYAGVVMDDTVRGTPIDLLLQPVARHSGNLRALNGLIGPPAMVAAICLQGEFVPDASGTDYQRDARGRPIPDARTAMMIQMLRYSMLQMAKVSDVKAEEIRERTEDMQVRMAAVDTMIDSVFSWVRPPQQGAAQQPPPGTPTPQPGGGGGQQPMPGTVYVYPPGTLTKMDATGADPARDAAAAATAAAMAAAARDSI